MRGPSNKEKIKKFMKELGHKLKKKGKLPGEDLVTKGLQDLSRDISSIAFLLVLIGAPRLNIKRN